MDLCWKSYDNITSPSERQKSHHHLHRGPFGPGGASSLIGLNVPEGEGDRQNNGLGPDRGWQWRYFRPDKWARPTMITWDRAIGLWFLRNQGRTPPDGPLRGPLGRPTRFSPTKGEPMAAGGRQFSWARWGHAAFDCGPPRVERGMTPGARAGRWEALFWPTPQAISSDARCGGFARCAAARAGRRDWDRQTCRGLIAPDPRAHRRTRRLGRAGEWNVLARTFPGSLGGSADILGPSPNKGPRAQVPPVEGGTGTARKPRRPQSPFAIRGHAHALCDTSTEWFALRKVRTFRSDLSYQRLLPGGHSGFQR